MTLPTRDAIAAAAYTAEKKHDFSNWTEEFADESEAYQSTYYAIADAVLVLLETS